MVPAATKPNKPKPAIKLFRIMFDLINLPAAGVRPSFWPNMTRMA
jgi:hypothetical protein